jgi:formylmethanofuran dehydrogenase subunit B
MSQLHEDVPCPFCGLACDDLKIQQDGGTLKVLAGGCPLSIPGFERIGDDAPPRVAGAPVASEQAIAEAARLIKTSRRVLFCGMGADVAGVRAALELADRVGGAVDPGNSDGMLRNVFTLQAGGYVATTLSEVKNRADLIVICGSDVVSRFPRFFERHVWNPESLFGDKLDRRIVYLGRGLDVEAGVSPRGHRPEVIDCDPKRLGEIAGALRAILVHRPFQAAEVAGVKCATLQSLAQRMAHASYGVLIWVAAELDFPHAELIAQSLAALVVELNRKTRFAALPLGGRNGDVTALQVTIWQTGYPLRVGFDVNGPQFEPYLYQADALARRGEVDCAVWISSFDAGAAPPDWKIPTIALGRSATEFAREPQVYFPVGTPGIDHAGHVFRTDNVVAVRLRKLRDSTLPSAADILTRIGKAL